MSDTNDTATGDTKAAGGGRDAQGRFAAGNRGGPGNPFARRTAAMRRAIAEAVTPQMLADLAAVMFKKGMAGDVAAAKLVFSYAAGRAAPPPDPDTLDADELAVRRNSTAGPEDMKALFERCPAWLLCAIAAVAAPQVQAHLETAFAQGVRRQGETEQRERERSPQEPGPYHGRLCDWAPDWLSLGIPHQALDVFCACPAWMPDMTGNDRMPEAYAELLRSVRSDLLDRLGAGDDPRQWLTSPDSKRDKRPGPAAARPGPDSGRPRSRAT